MKKSISEIFTNKSSALAPLAGVTDSVFRRICAGYGASPVMTEMVSVEGYTRGHASDKTARLLRFHESEKPVGYQFFGVDPDVFYAAIQRAMELNPDFIDINAGCPVKKVVAKGSGSALLQTPDILRKIVVKSVAAATVPVTVKIRSGWDHDSINAVDVAKTCVDAGASAIIVHPRTRSQGFSGDADWSVIRDVKEAIDVPVIGSGDIKTYADAKKMIAQTGVDSVMIGRAAMGNPWIFKQTEDYLAGKEVSKPMLVADRLDIALRHLDICTDEVSERFAVVNLRKFFGWYSRNAKDGATFRQTVFRAETSEEVKRIVHEFQAELRENIDNSYNSELVES